MNIPTDIGVELICVDRRQNPVTVGDTVTAYSSNYHPFSPVRSMLLSGRKSHGKTPLTRRRREVTG
jgi:hypothetical protein